MKIQYQESIQTQWTHQGCQCLMQREKKCYKLCDFKRLHCVGACTQWMKALRTRKKNRERWLGVGGMSVCHTRRETRKKREKKNCHFVYCQLNFLLFCQLFRTENDNVTCTRLSIFKRNVCSAARYTRPFICLYRDGKPTHRLDKKTRSTDDVPLIASVAAVSSCFIST